MSATPAPPPARAPSPRRLRLIGVAALLVAIGLALLGIFARKDAAATLQRQTEANAIPNVALVDPTQSDAQQQLILPGNVQAYYDAPIYARVPGYLKMWYVDIGARVKAGQLLAEIETPELDQQLRQAQADLATARAREKLAGITARRWSEMLSADSVSKQETDEKGGDFEAKAAATVSERANVERLQALQAFRRIVAPFDGTVTARKTDIGALINAGSNGAELFRIVDTHKLRVYVQVPQTYAAQVGTGMTAQLHFPEQPGRSVAATVVGTADAITESSRSQLVQLEVDNGDGKLVSGSYAEVHFDLPAAVGLQLPVTALLFRQRGMSVATLGPGDRVVIKSVQLGRDFGTRVEVVAGLAASDRVIDSPPDWLAQDDRVNVAPRPADGAGKQ